MLKKIRQNQIIICKMTVRDREFNNIFRPHNLNATVKLHDLPQLHFSFSI